MKKIIRFLFLFSLLSASNYAQQFETTERPTISVTGSAEIMVVPDIANIRMRVVKTDKNLRAAKTQNDASLAKLLDVTKKFEIPATDVKTDFISLKEKYDRVKQKGSDETTDVFAGYTVSRTIVVRLRDLKRFESFFSEIVESGVNEVSEVTFESSELRKFKDQARAGAVRAAHDKAEAIAKEIGQTIGKAFSIQEENVDGYRSAYANTSSNSFSIDGTEAGEDSAIGTISVKAQIKASFLLN
jgi:uncharacterized protein YggE